MRCSSPRVGSLLSSDVGKIPLLALPIYQFRVKVHEKLRVLMYEKDDYVLPKGSECQELYFLKTGTIDACGAMRGRVVFQIDQVGSYFGEESLMSMNTGFSYRASKEHTELYTIPAETLADAAATYLPPALRRSMAEAVAMEAKAKFRYRVLHMNVLIALIELQQRAEGTAPGASIIIAALKLQAGWLRLILWEMKTLPLEEVMDQFFFEFQPIPNPIPMTGAESLPAAAALSPTSGAHRPSSPGGDPYSSSFKQRRGFANNGLLKPVKRTHEASLDARHDARLRRIMRSSSSREMSKRVALARQIHAGAPSSGSFGSGAPYGVGLCRSESGTVIDAPPALAATASVASTPRDASDHVSDPASAAAPSAAFAAPSAASPASAAPASAAPAASCASTSQLTEEVRTLAAQVQAMQSQLSALLEATLAQGHPGYCGEPLE